MIIRTAIRSSLRSVLFTGVLTMCLAVSIAADERSRMTDESKEAVDALVRRDESVRTEIEKAPGYAIFPGVGKGGIGVGGARGSGQVFAGGTAVAKVTLTQVTVGLQLGGQKYIELIVFENQVALDGFLAGKFTMAAQASAVAAASGGAANAKFENGVKVITMAKGGLMYEASVGGQKFNVTKY
jgi:lipid-binding SYLF domain-containing protein